MVVKSVVNLAINMGHTFRSSWRFVLEIVSKLDELRLISTTVKKDELLL